MTERQEVTKLLLPNGEKVQAYLELRGYHHNFVAEYNGNDYRDSTLEGLEARILRHVQTRKERLDIVCMVEHRYGKLHPAKITSRNPSSGKYRVSILNDKGQTIDRTELWPGSTSVYRPMTSEEYAEYKQLYDICQVAKKNLFTFSKSFQINFREVVEKKERVIEERVKAIQKARRESMEKGEQS